MKYQSVRKISVQVFIISILIAIYLKFTFSTDAQYIATIISVCSAVISLLTFMTTTILALKKENRERTTTDIDNEKKRLENEKLAFEIEVMRNNTAKGKNVKVRKKY